jgi:hypothetical protein
MKPDTLKRVLTSGALLFMAMGLGSFFSKTAGILFIIIGLGIFFFWWQKYSKKKVAAPPAAPKPPEIVK